MIVEQINAPPARAISAQRGQAANTMSEWDAAEAAAFAAFEGATGA